MLRKELLESNIKKSNARIAPVWFDEHDYVWLGLLREECLRLVGRSFREFRQRFNEPLAFYAPRQKLKLALYYFEKELLVMTKKLSKKECAELRKVVFELSSQHSYGPPADDVTFVQHLKARSHKIQDLTPSSFKIDDLFADLPEERVIVGLKEITSHAELALKINLLLVKALLAKSDSIEVLVSGQSRALVRQAKLKGLICAVETVPDDDEFSSCIKISGPMAILRYTTMYGHAIGSVIPFLGRCDKFRLTAKIRSASSGVKIFLQSGDPFFPNLPLNEYDSKIEQAFSKDFKAHCQEWDLIREPLPLQVGRRLIFPDFAIKHRTANKTWLLEIMGFWTEAYIRHKIETFKNLKHQNFILCLSRKLNCGESVFPEHFKIVYFSRKIDPEEVYKIISL